MQARTIALLLTAGVLTGQVRADEAMLTKEEERLLRKNVYDEGRATEFPRTGKWALTPVLSVPADVWKIHGMKRLGTLRLLLVIVKGAGPKDAVLATGYAVALEEDVEMAGTYASYRLDRVDAVVGDGGEKTGRDELVARVQRHITKVEKGNTGGK
jgi:hypothetical protein